MRHSTFHNTYFHAEVFNIIRYILSMKKSHSMAFISYEKLKASEKKTQKLNVFYTSIYASENSFNNGYKRHNVDHS